MHEDYGGEADAPELSFPGLPASLLDVLDDWVSSHADEVRQLLRET